MAHHPAYSAYDPSGIEWIGLKPAGWGVKPFLVHAPQCKRSNKGMVNDNLLSLSFGRIVKKDIDSSEGLLPESFETYQIVEPNDIVFRLTDLQNDKRSLRSALSTERGIITSAYLAVKPEAICPRYLAYQMRVYDVTKVFYSLGSGLRQSLKYNDMKRLPLLIPSPREQTTIAAFLDHETAKIDALIERQQQLIALLKEKRQAVISHAVTKGLNPEAPMRDSGIEWLGKVPAHWKVSEMKYVVKPGTAITYGIVQAGPHIDGGIPYIKTSDMSGEVLPVSGYSCTSKAIDESYRRSRVFPGDIVISIRASVGKCLPVPDQLVIANLTQGTAKISPGPKISRDFLLAYLSASSVQDYLMSMAKGATFKEITLDMLRRVPVLVPPTDEQLVLAAHMQTLAEKYERLAKAARDQMELLRERRTALISAAVTGKIDVRGWKYPEPQAKAV